MQLSKYCIRDVNFMIKSLRARNCLDCMSIFFSSAAAGGGIGGVHLTSSPPLAKISLSFESHGIGCTPPIV